MVLPRSDALCRVGMACANGASSKVCRRGLVHGTGFDFRTTEAAQAFVDAFPMLELADGAEGWGYGAPVGSGSS